MKQTRRQEIVDALGVSLENLVTVWSYVGVSARHNTEVLTALIQIGDTLSKIRKDIKLSMEEE